MVIRLLCAIFIIAMALAALKLAIVAGVLLGLIFRTKETIGLFLFFGAVALLGAYPKLVISIGLVLLAICIYYKRKEKRAPSDTTVTYLPAPDD